MIRAPDHFAFTLSTGFPPIETLHILLVGVGLLPGFALGGVGRTSKTKPKDFLQAPIQPPPPFLLYRALTESRPKPT